MVFGLISQIIPDHKGRSADRPADRGRSTQADPDRLNLDPLISACFRRFLYDPDLAQGIRGSGRSDES